MVDITSMEHIHANVWASAAVHTSGSKMKEKMTTKNVSENSSDSITEEDTSTDPAQGSKDHYYIIIFWLLKVWQEAE